MLFVMPNLAGGGAEKSLVTLLRVLGERHGGGAVFDADLLLFERRGLFLDQVPEWVRVLDTGGAYGLFTGGVRTAIWTYLRRGRLDLVFRRLVYAAAWRGDPAKRALRCWRALRHALPRLPGEYAAAVGCMEGYASYFAADNVWARRKISWFHSDCGKLPELHAANRVYFPRFDAVVGVSEACCEEIRGYHPGANVVCVENIISAPPCRCGDIPPRERRGLGTILTIARLAHVKGVDLAVQACGILKRAGVKFRWDVIGGGEEEGALQALIEREDVADRFFLVGEKINPYPWLAACDVYVQPSRFEGKCIAIEEAKALGRPVLCTSFPTAASSVTHGETGLICEMTPEGIAGGVRQLLEDPGLREQFTKNLADFRGNEGEAAKVMELFQIK